MTSPTSSKSPSPRPPSRPHPPLRITTVAGSTPLSRPHRPAYFHFAPVLRRANMLSPKSHDVFWNPKIYYDDTEMGSFRPPELRRVSWNVIFKDPTSSRPSTEFSMSSSPTPSSPSSSGSAPSASPA